MPTTERDGEDRLSITFEISREVWDLLIEVADDMDKWKEVAAKALEAGLEQARTPTAMGLPSRWRG